MPQEEKIWRNLVMPKPYSIDLREKIIKAYHHGKEPVERKKNTISGVAKRFQVSEKFVKNLLKLYRKTGSVAPRPHGGGHTPQISSDGFKYLSNIVKTQPDLTIDEYRQIYNAHFEGQVSASTIGRALDRLKLTRKKKTKSDPRKYTVKNQFKRKLYQWSLRHLDPKQLIYLDETGATINMIRDYARSPSGQRAYATKSLNRGTRVSTIGALCHNGLVAELCFEGTLNTHIFNYFIKNLLAPKLKKGDVVILDNASAHDPDEIRDILAPFFVKVMFLPPYSPELNPIELIWSQVKHFLKKHTVTTTEALYQVVAQALQIITPLSAHNCLQHCLRETRKKWNLIWSPRE